MARLGLLGAVGLGATAIALARGWGWQLRALVGWDTTALTLLVLCWLLISRSAAEATQQMAASADPGGRPIVAIVLGACAFSLFASVVLLREAPGLPRPQAAILVALALLAVASSWALSHTIYAFRYAHLHYGDPDDIPDGLIFPGDEQPSYADFAYFSFTIGMCFGTTDVKINECHVRRAVTPHAVLSFAYNTVILALTLSFTNDLLG
jgi:uncharacterized membrane protein